MRDEHRDEQEPITGEEVNYTALGLATLRKWPEGLKRAVRREGHWEDLLQTVALSAWEAKMENLPPREASALCQRNLHGTLQGLGWRKVRGHYVRQEVPVGRIRV